MASTTRIITNLSETYLLQDGTELYFKKLRNAFIDIKNDKECDYLYFAFITLCAATLEYSLNHALISFCITEFGPKDYKPFAETYINYPFGKKLLHAPYITSHGKYRFNDNHNSIKSLFELISLRNRLLHSKEYLRKIEIPWQESQDTIENLEIEITLKTHYIEDITKDECLKYAEAMGDFKKYFLIPVMSNNIETNELIILK
jgi:hypothetical protein